MNSQDKITLAIGLAFLGFVLTLTTGCATDGQYRRPIDWGALQRLNQGWDTQAPKQSSRIEQTCTIQEVPTLSGRAIYRTVCE